MSSDFPNFGKSTPGDRASALLRGRTPFRWMQWVGLTKGSIDRLVKGNLPTPELLTTACRAENCSMSWLYDGMGAPYLVRTVTDQVEAQGFVRMSTQDERWNVLLVEHWRRSMVVLHQPASVALKNGGECRYEAVSIVAGRYDAIELVEEMRAANVTDAIRHLHLPVEAFVRLSCGYLSASELFGWLDEPGGLAAKATDYLGPDLGDNVHYLHDTGRRVGELSSPAYTDIDRAIEMLRAMESEQRAMALRILGAIPDP